MRPRSVAEVFRVLEEHRERLRALGVRRLGLFGSLVRHEARETSDLDFLVELEHETFDSYMEVKEFLEELFACPVDLVLMDAIKPRLRDSILREAVYAPGF